VPAGETLAAAAARDYHDLWRWSVEQPAAFWGSLWDYFAVLGERGEGPVLTGGPMPGVTWFAGATLNYARNALRTALTDPTRIAVIGRDEEGEPATLTYAELAAEVARVRAGLAALGVARGDRVAAFLPNTPAAVIGLLATASLGAIWSSCSPDFGPHSVIDRFAQITPKVLLATGRYRLRRQGLRPAAVGGRHRRRAAGSGGDRHGGRARRGIGHAGDHDRALRVAARCPGDGAGVRGRPVRPSAVGAVLVRHHRPALRRSCTATAGSCSST
jgi:hypothetical protein